MSREIALTTSSGITILANVSVSTIKLVKLETSGTVIVANAFANPKSAPLDRSGATRTALASASSVPTVFHQPHTSTLRNAHANASHSSAQWARSSTSIHAGANACTPSVKTPLTTSTPLLATAFASPRNAATASTSTPRSATASARTQLSTTRDAHWVSTSPPTTANASATQLLEETFANLASFLTSTPALAFARLKLALAPRSSTRPPANASAAPRSAQTTSTGTMSIANASAPQLTAVPIDTGTRTIADASASLTSASLISIMFIILILRNASASAPTELLAKSVPLAKFSTKASVLVSPAHQFARPVLTGMPELTNASATLRSAQKVNTGELTPTTLLSADATASQNTALSATTGMRSTATVSALSHLTPALLDPTGIASTADAYATQHLAHLLKELLVNSTTSSASASALTKATAQQANTSTTKPAHASALHLKRALRDNTGTPDSALASLTQRTATAPSDSTSISMRLSASASHNSATPASSGTPENAPASANTTDPALEVS